MSCVAVVSFLTLALTIIDPNINRAVFSVAPAQTAIVTTSEGLPATASLLFVGDIMLSRGIGNIMHKREDVDYPFALITEQIRTADLAFANLESPISDRGTNMGSIYSFRADPQAVQGLKNADFDVVSTANNHAWDYGGDAYTDTLALLDSVGIGHAGGGMDHAGAHTPVIRTVNGTRFAFLGYTNLIPRGVTTVDAHPAVAFLDIEAVKQDIAAAKQAADVVIVSYHWGEEYKTAHNAWQEDIAHQTIDAGAALVIGHHPHVVEEVEQYHGGYIAYSLGNFVFDQNFSADTHHGLMLSVVFENGAVKTVTPTMVDFTDTFQPYVNESLSAPTIIEVS
ncbi:MAG: hypothetical protein A2675_02170 [Candidatus Yonathbacteria bacterium RIFCSPHIGHO2_01_FULL_51_10]|uniref:Capsule synthesis protein CapA domain-containing protein n=1 Tax=Candidatus Yonathbacteria bacterium RIFCSPHIGHO2_01_FULL_51_10 TaxID=1802723 RepID=A0A1G2S7B3_9BACT|nr:MAG: hypothetical protein A2675_02170 [Candidatus Yonathbacteria bacterium RIFCSPHIGHO2_01_FULL_51_10]